MKNTFSSNPEYIATTTSQRIQELIPLVSKSEARVAQFILLNLDQISYETGASIAEKAAVSQITVSRFLKRAGYQGISSLKEELQKEFIPIEANESQRISQDSFYKDNLKQELKSMVRLYEQFETENWESLVSCVSAATRVYVSGFQSIRGTAEDFTRRLSLARDRVQYLSPHDGMLGEWLEDSPRGRKGYDTLIILDVVPYASEGRKLCEVAAEKGIQIVIISDEFCHWASEYNAHIVYSKSKSGLFLESTWGLVLTTNMLIDAVSRRDVNSDKRIKRWQEMAKRFDLF
ncbi:MurR/RpiR family transcriptional regulator [Marinomonas sp. CT5]|uniref:MurR/RpiR family transcriptional regulator n=1 Tax=Marinomonas sp. CT5 TaxID=2066133 RepID=UPI0017AF8408|nr:MurR/RpiR family transcriptional regulator [Marinomonas sp. CT5]NVK72823.1 MurR/RpiR family transcriptional regulator [Oceanospirillaceae bacterium]QUX98047.1 MurR/RpiR family transcriptional regulator [Marinomonas sp. CT5]